MFKKLGKKWGVNGLRLLLVLCTFAIGGTLSAIVAKKVMNFTGIEKNGWYYLIYIIVVTIVWPLCVLIVSILTGQYAFFTRYLKKMAQRMKLMPQPQPPEHTLQLAVFASGAGSNAARLMEHFNTRPGKATVSLIVCNKEGAGVIKIAENKGIKVLMLEKEDFFRGENYLQVLKAQNIDWIILAGFLWKIPKKLIDHYPQKIVNIHPALLPKYGGKGMYGQHVHQAVIDNGETASGITIHFVDELYDHGAVIFQAQCPVSPADTPESLAQKIHALEHAHFAPVVEKLF